VDLVLVRPEHLSPCRYDSLEPDQPIELLLAEYGHHATRIVKG
jgi:hypothetical protein